LVEFLRLPAAKAQQHLAAFRLFDALDPGSVNDSRPKLFQARREFIRESLISANEGAQACAAGVQTRPHPGHVDLFGIALAKLAIIIGSHMLSYTLFPAFARIQASVVVFSSFCQLLVRRRYKPTSPKRILLMPQPSPG
jgi:hypothetical protein